MNTTTTPAHNAGNPRATSQARRTLRQSTPRGKLRDTAGYTNAHRNTLLDTALWLHQCSTHFVEKRQPEVFQKAITKYENWKPRDTKRHDFQTQQDIDAALHKSWSNRLIDNLALYNLPYIVANLERHQQQRLLGKNK